MRAVMKVLIVVFVLVLATNWCYVESKVLQSKPAAREGKEVKSATDSKNVISAILKVASTIHSEQLTAMRPRGLKQLDAIYNDVTSVRREIENIWEESKQKWYFGHIENITNETKKIIVDLKMQDNSFVAKKRRQRFINQVLGGDGNDKYVEKALSDIPELVTKQGLVTSYFDVQRKKGKSKREAAKLTWMFVKKLFRYQEDGYASVVLAAALKYKNHEAPYSDFMSKVCKWWPKLRDTEYESFCDKFINDPDSENRRKQQQDFLFANKDLANFPAQLIKTDCNHFRHSHDLLYSKGYLYITHPATNKILVVDTQTLNILSTINVPGSMCGGRCYPFSIAIEAEHKVMAMPQEGFANTIMMFNIIGNLSNPRKLAIEHYYTMDNVIDVNSKQADVRSIAFCGDRFAYADYNGVIRNWKMPPNKRYMGWNDGKWVPDLGNRYDWALNRKGNTYKGHEHYIRCSNSGQHWLMEKDESGTTDDEVAVVSAHWGLTNDIFNTAYHVVVTASDWDHRKDRSRIKKIRGIAMDTKGNIFYSSGISGVHQRTTDGKHRIIRELEPNKTVKMFGMAVDDSGFLFSVQKDGLNNKCLYKYDHEIDLEDIKVL